MHTQITIFVKHNHGEFECHKQNSPKTEIEFIQLCCRRQISKWKVNQTTLLRTIIRTHMEFNLFTRDLWTKLQKYYQEQIIYWILLKRTGCTKRIITLTWDRLGLWSWNSLSPAHVSSMPRIWEENGRIMKQNRSGLKTHTLINHTIKLIIWLKFHVNLIKSIVHQFSQI